MTKYQITAPAPVTGKGWGLAFVEGEAETEDATLAAKLKAKGYTVTEAGAGDTFTCPACGKEYKTAKGMEDHMAKEHPDYKPGDESTGGDQE